MVSSGTLELELGAGFAFLGREYRIVIGETEQFLDMLFYHVQLHCYIVVEVKITAFDSRDMGRLGTYVAAGEINIRPEAKKPLPVFLCGTSWRNRENQYILGM